MDLLKGKIAIVTGAACGIGRAIALQFAAEGAGVAAVDMSPAALEALSGELRKSGAPFLTEVCDVSDEAAVNRFAEKVRTRFGRIDILVNNAGLWRENILPFAESKSEYWLRKINVNVLGTMYFAHAVLDGMIGQRCGRIINIASVAGVYGIRRMVDYCTTKGAVISFTTALAKEVTEYGVTVNAVSPGNIRSREDEPENTVLSFARRSGTPREIADVVTFLAGDSASYVSGQNWLVDGCRASM